MWGVKMDKIAIISDIHGNIPALEAVLSDIQSRGIERIICLGDLAGKGPGSETAIDIIKEKCEIVLKGNWDYLISEIYDSYFLKWHRSKLRDSQLDYLMNLPVYRDFYVSGRLIRFFHSKFDDLFHKVTPVSTLHEKMALFDAPCEESQKCDMVVYGHLHTGFIEYFKDKALMNVGSVGNPLDMTQAAYGIIEGTVGKKERSGFSLMLVRVEYDIERAIQQALDSGMPDLQEYIGELRSARYREIK